MASASEALPMPETSLRVRFAALLTEHEPGLRRVARAYARSTAESEDLFQEIALGIWRALPSFRGACSERTFVFRVAHNRGITFAALRRPQGEEVEDWPAGAPTPEESANEAQRRDALWRGIRELAPGARAVLTLALEGLSHDEIGDVLGITANAVGVRLSRAREELRRTLGRRP
jgi:RNA polymerase sigma factor (sigma-70 family)